MDPWKHRSDNMKCKTCMWFASKASHFVVTTESLKNLDFEGAISKAASSGCVVEIGTTEDFEKIEPKLGRCRRHAPTMNGYPVVFVNDWCGDHKVDENKV